MTRLVSHCRYTRGHHGDAYAALPVKQIERPPYSPELNPAERIFEYLRDEIEGVIYGSICWLAISGSLSTMM